MALPIHYRRVHGPATSDNIDDNFEVLANAIEDLQARADDGVQIDTITQSDDLSALIITLTDGRQFGPFQIGSGVVPAGEWAAGVAYNRGAITSKDGSSYICMIPHEAEDLQADLALGKWMILAAKGEGSGGGGGPGDPQPFYMSMTIPGTPAVGTYTRIVIPRKCSLAIAGIKARSRTAPGAGKSVEIAMAKYATAFNAMTPVGSCQFNGGSTVAAPYIAGGASSIVLWPGEALEMGIYSESAGHGAGDYAVTFELTPVE